MLGDISVRRKVVTSAAIAGVDAFRWTVVFLSKVRTASKRVQNCVFGATRRMLVFFFFSF